MSKLVIGLTGGIGSGKTTVADLFAQYGIDIIDADIVAREVVAPGTSALAKISEHFGSDYILENGHLDRAKLRHRVFANKQDKTWLNRLLHPLIRETMNGQCVAAKSAYCFIVAPLLIENGLNKSVEKVLVIDVKPETQIARTVARDSNSKEQVQNILAAQVSREDRLAHADFIIDNDVCSTNELKQQVESLHRIFLKLVIEK
ncbi:dephospho-CoA kinase [Thalassotalea sp. ND16A]|uniref:dephospho-CoA kinase n=1 Tax=Thalassotalea sp. ND16A TaxID=1535422 RepID=UPI00051A1238|nr:dephospho-CoA kinase [Thalassotalea sp. ND16A]KGK01154.1 Dephospho-CoA kinase [Thalassotalea sp. ND16A]